MNLFRGSRIKKDGSVKNKLYLTSRYTHGVTANKILTKFQVCTRVNNHYLCLMLSWMIKLYYELFDLTILVYRSREQLVFRHVTITTDNNNNRHF